MSADTPLVVRVTPTFNELLRFNWSVGVRRMRLLALIALFWTGVVLCVPLMAVAQPELVPMPQGARAIPYAVPVLLLVMVVFVYVPLATYIGLRKQWRTVEQLREPRTYTFTVAGMEVVGTSFAGFTAWSNVSRAERSGGLVLLAIGPQQFHLVPVSVFDRPEVWEQFARLVRANVSDCRL
ncbi:MAG TPA: YcxB family protein [Gemmata sp.]